MTTYLTSLTVQEVNFWMPSRTPKLTLIAITLKKKISLRIALLISNLWLREINLHLSFSSQKTTIKWITLYMKLKFLLPEMSNWRHSTEASNKRIMMGLIQMNHPYLAIITIEPSVYIQITIIIVLASCLLTTTKRALIAVMYSGMNQCW